MKANTTTNTTLIFLTILEIIKQYRIKVFLLY